MPPSCAGSTHSRRRTSTCPPGGRSARSAERIAEARGLSDDDLTFLLVTCDETETALAELRYVLQPGPIHGDGFLGNLIPGPGGAVICDFDSTSTGPREWDLTTVAVGKLRFNYPNDTHGELASAYRFDVTS